MNKKSYADVEAAIKRIDQVPKPESEDGFNFIRVTLEDNLYILRGRRFDAICFREGAEGRMPEAKETDIVSIEPTQSNDIYRPVWVRWS